MTETKPTPDKSALSRERILRAAMALADADGLENLSMRKLAQALGVEAMSLYNHVKNKEDMLDGMVEQIVTGFHAPKDQDDWLAELRLRATCAHATLTRHPWAAHLLLGRVNAGPRMLGYVDATLGCLHKAGFAYQDADRIWNALDSHIYGFALQDQKFPFKPEEFASVAAQYLPQIPQSDLPHLHALTSEVAAGQHYGAQDFSFGLNLLLDAIARLPRHPA